MSVTINGSTLVPNADREYKGLSTDTKPTNCAINSLFLELDTKKLFYYDGDSWEEVGANA